VDGYHLIPAKNTDVPYNEYNIPKNKAEKIESDIVMMDTDNRSKHGKIIWGH